MVNFLKNLELGNTNEGVFYLELHVLILDFIIFSFYEIK